MSKATKIKWIAGMILAGVLISLGLAGGSWGKIYTANANVAPVPIITRLIPNVVPAGSPDKVVVVEGTIIGNEHDTGVRFSGEYFDGILHPPEVYQFGTSVNVTDTLMAVPTVYTVTVVISRRPADMGGPTIPHLPIWYFDDVSNVLTFTVVEVQKFFLPIITIKP